MKWLRKWYYMILFLASGIIYLSCIDKWQVYAEPMEQARALYKWVVSGGRPEESTDLLAKGPDTGDGSREDGTGTSPEGFPGQNEPSSSEEPVKNKEGGVPQSSFTGTDNGSGVPESGVNESGVPDTEGMGGTGADGAGTEGAGGTGSDGAGIDGMGTDGEEGGEANGEPVYVSVEDDYFADAVFIGDSRTVGMYEYGGLQDISTFYASTGLTVYKLFDAEIVSQEGQKKKISVEEALQKNSFAKIYLMIGINEMGRGTVETFIEKYKEVVAHLQELQPDAIIYIQGIIKVTTARSEQGDYINNEGIVARNEELEKLADNEKIFYLDVNPLICDDSGGMVSDYTFDGVHLKAKYIDIWKDFLKSHAIIF